MTDARKPLWPKIVATVVVLMPVQYVLSIGPLEGMAMRDMLPGVVISSPPAPCRWRND